MKTHEPMILLDDEQQANVDQPHPMKADIPIWPAYRAFCREVIESYDCGDLACN
jgi:arylformamidase